MNALHRLSTLHFVCDPNGYLKSEIWNLKLNFRMYYGHIAILSQ